MKAPQSLCQKIATIGEKKLQAIGEYGCCAFTLLWCLGIEPDDDVKAINTLVNLMNAKAIREDCLVYWKDAIKFLTGRESDVEFVDITTIKDIKGRTPVLFEYNGSEHWVGVENGEVKFNSLNKSVCVEKGNPTQARIIKIQGV